MFTFQSVNLIKRYIVKATAKDLRFHSKEILDTVSRGEEVIITVRGMPQAKLIPLDKDDNRKLHSSSIFGIWKDNKNISIVEEYTRKIRKGRFQ